MNLRKVMLLLSTVNYKRFKFEIMQAVLSQQDATKLYYILDEANRSYLKESQINQKASFNILRVLSAYRLVCPDASNSLYNAIIYLTKIFNPQTLNEWKRAIADWQKMSSMPPKNNKVDRKTRRETSKYMKTFQNSYNMDRTKPCHFQSKSFAQIQVPGQLSISQQISVDRSKKQITETNISAKTGKMYFYTKADSLENDGQNHYVSFEPYHQISGIYPQYFHNEKQNVNSTNIDESRKGKSTEQYIQAIRRDLNITGKLNASKSPIDQSFIKNIDCYESQHLPPQQTIEVEDSEQEQMSQTANDFLRINLKLKAFESLRANSMVLLNAKQHRLKADMQNKATLLQRSFFALRDNVSIQQHIRSNEKKADSHYGQKTQRKIYNILKLLFELRNKRPPFNVFNLNTVSYEFILSLLLSIQNREESDEFDFNNKISELLQSNKINKVCQIVKYFGKYSWISQQKIEKILQLYRRSIMTKVFRAFQKEQKQNLRYCDHNEIKIEKRAFFILKAHLQKSKLLKIKMLEAERRKNKRLIGKAMKGFVQIICSKKLYSKRFEYLQVKHNSCIKSRIFQNWFETMKLRKSYFEELKHKIKTTVGPFNRFMKLYALRQIREDTEQLSDKQHDLFSWLVTKKLKKAYKSLYLLRLSKSEAREIQEKNKILAYSKGLKRWKQNTKKGKAFKSIEKIVKKITFRQIVAPALTLAITELRIIQNNDTDIKKKTIKALKYFYQTERQATSKLSQLINNRICTLGKRSFLKLLCNNHEQQIRQLQKIEREAKIIDLEKYFLQRKYIDFKEKFIERKQKNLEEIKINKKLEIKEKKRALKNFGQIAAYHCSLKRNSKQLSQLIKASRQIQVKKHLVEQTALIQLRKLISKKSFFSKLKQFAQHQKKIISVSGYYQNRKLQSFMAHFMKNEGKAKRKQMLQYKSDSLLRWIAINSVKSHYMTSLINKKYIYMAVKFRSLKISSMVFEKWKQFRYVPATKVKTHSMMNRTAKDRLSTDIME